VANVVVLSAWSAKVTSSSTNASRPTVPSISEVCSTASGSAQSPPTQAVSVEHAVAQSPQWAAEVCGSTQPPAHSISGAVHAAEPWHAPATQVSPVSQPRPQVPQLLGSIIRSTQVVPHTICVHGGSLSSHAGSAARSVGRSRPVAKVVRLMAGARAAAYPVGRDARRGCAR
jgi:hypothetical protein